MGWAGLGWCDEGEKVEPGRKAPAWPLRWLHASSAHSVSGASRQGPGGETWAREDYGANRALTDNLRNGQFRPWLKTTVYRTCITFR